MKNKREKQTLTIFFGLVAAVGTIWWWSGEVEKQRLATQALTPDVANHYDRQKRIPEMILYER